MKMNRSGRERDRPDADQARNGTPRKLLEPGAGREESRSGWAAELAETRPGREAEVVESRSGRETEVEESRSGRPAEVAESRSGREALDGRRTGDGRPRE